VSDHATPDPGDRTDAGASHETDRHTENQPPREDLIPTETLEDLEDEADEEADPFLSEDDAILPRPTAEDLPESQGMDVAEGRRIAEDPVDRPPLSDETPL
jgi:hypothetical protein